MTPDLEAAVKEAVWKLCSSESGLTGGAKAAMAVALRHAAAWHNERAQSVASGYLTKDAHHHSFNHFLSLVTELEQQ